MKNLLTLVVCILFTYIGFGQKTKTIETDIFKIVYSEKYQQPLSVEYEVQCPNGNASRKGMNFYRVDSVITSNNADYKNNVWDKGHMAPAAHFSDSEENLRLTFSYLNSALQHEKLNRGAWRFLEAHVRKLSEGADIHVTNFIIFSPSSEQLSTGATVPDGFIKKLHFPSTGVQQCYFFTNEAPEGKYTDYQVDCE